MQPMDVKEVFHEMDRRYDTAMDEATRLCYWPSECHHAEINLHFTITIRPLAHTISMESVFETVNSADAKTIFLRNLRRTEDRWIYVERDPDAHQEEPDETD